PADTRQLIRPTLLTIYPDCDNDPRHTHPFPTRRSSDLGRGRPLGARRHRHPPRPPCPHRHRPPTAGAVAPVAVASGVGGGAAGEDRKSTRLNSSHVKISYAVFCLKKKNM